MDVRFRTRGVEKVTSRTRWKWFKVYSPDYVPFRTLYSRPFPRPSRVFPLYPSDTVLMGPGLGPLNPLHHRTPPTSL